ncbi:MAG: hypothetical protein IPL86_15010 [Flavobacteriales bacterium]|nr:hypothetical protein [Flavobacteriales bacterium]
MISTALSSTVDEHVFGMESFRAQFTRNDDGVDYKELKERIRPLLHRTLRRQVREHVPWTERIPITIQFHPTEEEQELYDRVTEYLHQDLLYAMPDGKRHLVTMILHKLLASSSFAVTRTLEKLIKGLEYLLEEKAPSEDFMAALFADMDGLDDVEDEWEEDEEESRSAAGGEEHEKKKKSEHLSAEEIEAVKAELKQLKSFRELSVSITHNAKGDKLFTALEQGFEQLKKIGANKKAIIFTESRRTQEYL